MIIVEDFNPHFHQWADNLDPKNQQRNTRDKLHYRALDLTDIYRTFHPTGADTTFFSQHMRHYQGYTIHQSTKQVLINLKKNWNHP